MTAVDKSASRTDEHTQTDDAADGQPVGVGRVSRVTRFYRSHATLVFRAAPVESTVAAVLTVLGAASSTAAILLLGKVVGAGVTAISTGPHSPEAHQAMVWVVWLAATFLLSPLVGGAINVLSQQILSKTAAYAGMLLTELANAPVGIAHLEDTERAARLQTLVKSIHEWTYLEGVGSTWGVIQSRLAGLGAFGVMAAWHWWAAVLLAAGYVISGRALTKWLLTVFADMVLEPPLGRRKSQYVFGLLMKGEAAKEIRLFGLSGWMIQRYRDLWSTAMVDVWKRRGATIGPVFATTIVMIVCALTAYGQMGREAWAGTLPVSTLTALVGASVAMWALGMLGDEQVMFTQSMATTDQLRAAREAINLPGLEILATPARRAIAPGKHEPAEVRIRNLRFTYPSRDEPIFEGLDLTIPAGQSIAVVGVNGAGKSTLIKLLCGLYAPDSGEVLVDGSAPARDARARERVAVIFQEFVRYQLSLKDNVALGARGVIDTDAVVRQALHDAAADDVLSRLDGDWDTVLSGEYKGGTDLSGGQWQRVALARALAAIAGGSGVLVLDEPTAALDVRAEAQLFDRFLDVTRGMTTLLVSHRLSSVRHADRIVVIENGRIVEDGSHADLLRRGGRYADMFTLQASRFASASGAPVSLDDAEEQESVE
jgi:ABC-type multidrug transport system fused ATPase/permease subunit